MVSVKGTAIAGRRQYLLRYHGPEKLRAVLAQLKDREVAQRLETGVLKSAWYPFDLYIELSEIIDRVVGRGDGSLYRSISAQTAEDDMSTVYKVFFKFLQPMYVFGKATQLWNAYYSSGSFQVNPLGPGKVEFEVADFEAPNWAHCESVIGWVERTVQLTGVKGVHSEHLECRARGASRCRMRITWQAS